MRHEQQVAQGNNKTAGDRQADLRRAKGDWARDLAGNTLNPHPPFSAGGWANTLLL